MNNFEVQYKSERSFAKYVGLLATCLMLSACGPISEKISATFARVQDFKRTEIISNGPVVADGQAELLVVIQLMNSDGTPVKLYKPTYEIVSGGGVTAQACTTSNANGVSTCVLKANQPGTKRLSVTNIKIALEADVEFTPPAAKAIFGITSAAITQTQGSFQLTATIGDQETGLVKTSGAFKLYGGVKGEAVSR